MDTERQFITFCLCITTGFIGGIIYEPFSFVHRLSKCLTNKNKLIGIITDLLFCFIFSLLCVYASYKFHFGGFRMYMCIGFGGGFIIYLKILHRIVAFFEKVCYNTYIQKVKRNKKARKNSQKEVNINI